MKKLLASAFVLVLLLAISVPIFAAGNDNISVSGKYVYTAAPGIVESELTDGKYEAVVEDIPVTVTPDTPQDDLRLVLKVIPETHEEAHDWFGDVLEDHGDKILPLDIHFVDEEENRVELHGTIRISVKIPEGFESPIVCYVSDEGQVTVMDSTIEDGFISWTTDHNSYYVLVERTGTVDPSAPTESTTPGGPSTTGDQNNNSLWVVVMILSGVAIVALVVIGMRKKKED